MHGKVHIDFFEKTFFETWIYRVSYNKCCINKLSFIVEC